MSKLAGAFLAASLASACGAQAAPSASVQTSSASPADRTGGDAATYNEQAVPQAPPSVAVPSGLPSGISGRYGSPERVTLPARMFCEHGPGDVYAYQTRLRLSISTEMTEGGAAPSLSRSEMSIWIGSALEVEEGPSDRMVRYVWTSEALAVEGFDGLDAKSLPVARSTFVGPANACGTTRLVQSDLPNLNAMLQAAGVGFVAEMLAMPPPLKFVMPTTTPVRPGDMWATTRRPAPPDIQGFLVDTRLPLMEISFTADAVTPEVGGGASLPVTYSTSEASETSADLFGGALERAADGGGDAPSTWELSYTDGEIAGRVLFRLSSMDGRVLAVPSSVSETYTGRIDLRQAHGVLPGILLDIPPIDRTTIYVWEAHAITTLTGAASSH